MQWLLALPPLAPPASASGAASFRLQLPRAAADYGASLTLPHSVTPLASVRVTDAVV